MAGWGLRGSKNSYVSSRVKLIISEIERMTSQSLSNLPVEKRDELISSRLMIVLFGIGDKILYCSNKL